MRKYAIRNRHEPSHEDFYVNVLVCRECSASLAMSFPGAKEISEVLSDPTYDDHCELCGVSFLEEIEASSIVRPHQSFFSHNSQIWRDL